jgi:2-polyprenyl-3-methyl-5-hydroxy-6-metoxy-1,4-benzoquinol methylase
MKFVSKEDKIVEVCKGRTVLHLGCVGFADSSPEERILLAERSLHALLTKIATTKGIDYCREAIDFFSQHDVFNNVLHGNVERLEEMTLEGKFDVIVAGDILEHLANPGLMLEGIKRFTHGDTLVLITTPHSFGFLNFIRFIRGRFVEGAEHVMTFNSQNIENLCGRLGYEVKSIDTCYQKHATQKPFFEVGRRFYRYFPKFGGTLFVVCRIK